MPQHASSTAAGAWRIAPGRSITLDAPRLMAVINITPDSFSDGGLHADPAAALSRCRQVLDEGADNLDIGPESTRPGADPVSSDVQIRRALPVIAAIREAGITAPLSIDTTSTAVARAALDAGADIINDTSAGRDDVAMLSLAAERACGLILMHRRTTPRLERFSTEYSRAPSYDEQGGIVAAVRRFLQERAAAANSAGVRRESIVLDPGLGFGKSVEQNFALLAAAPELRSLGFPLLCAASRKSFIGAASGEPDPARRVAGSIAAAVEQYHAGVRLFRVHDVADHAAALRVAASLSSPGESRRTGIVGDFSPP